MLKALLLIAPLALTADMALAAEYGKMKCDDLAGDQLRGAQVIGWLNLSNRGAGDRQEIFLDNVRENVSRLLNTCNDAPDLALHVAAAMSLAEIGSEERGDLVVTASPALDPMVEAVLREIFDNVPAMSAGLATAELGAEPFIEATTVLQEITPATAAPPMRAGVAPFD